MVQMAKACLTTDGYVCIEVASGGAALQQAMRVVLSLELVFSSEGQVELVEGEGNSRDPSEISSKADANRLWLIPETSSVGVG